MDESASSTVKNLVGSNRLSDLLSDTVKQSIGTLTILGSYFAALIASLTAYGTVHTVLGKLGASDWKYSAAVTALPILLVFFMHSLPAWLARQRANKLSQLQYGTVPVDYFRLTAYQQTDQDRFIRDDGLHEKIRCWLLANKWPLIYITGASGTGKSSLLNAFVIPALKDAEPSVMTIKVRLIDEPIQEITKALTAPQVVWDKPPNALQSLPLPELLEKAQRKLKRPLLLLLDQFEELLILHQQETQEAFLNVLKAWAESPIESVTICLVYRSDYMDMMVRTALPQPRHGDNWYEVGAFTLGEARAFYERADADFDPQLIEDLVTEASELEETRGKCRPVSLNMLGKVLEWFSGDSAKFFKKAHQPGAILNLYLKSVLDQSDIRDYSRLVLTAMISNRGTKKPVDAGTLQAQINVDAGAILGCLVVLAHKGLVRRIEVGGHALWEISHDFVARLLDHQLNISRPHRLQHRLKQALPVALALVIIGIWASPYVTHYIALNQLAEYGIESKAYPEKGFYITVESGADNRALQLVRRLRNVHTLRVDVAQGVTDLSPLAGLKHLKNLRLRQANLVKDLAPLAELHDLEFLELRNAKSLTDLRPLAELRELKILDLSYAKNVKDLRPLAGLKSLVVLLLSGSDNVTDLGPLAGLTNLTTLYLNSMDGITDLRPLVGLQKLQTLNLVQSDRVTDLSPLAKLDNLLELTVHHLKPGSEIETRFVVPKCLMDIRVVEGKRENIAKRILEQLEINRQKPECITLKPKALK